jgi:hypothetical protein
MSEIRRAGLVSDDLGRPGVVHTANLAEKSPLPPTGPAITAAAVRASGQCEDAGFRRGVGRFHVLFSGSDTNALETTRAGVSQAS